MIETFFIICVIVNIVAVMIHLILKIKSITKTKKTKKLWMKLHDFIKSNFSIKKHGVFYYGGKHSKELYQLMNKEHDFNEKQVLFMFKVVDLIHKSLLEQKKQEYLFAVQNGLATKFNLRPSDN